MIASKEWVKNLLNKCLKQNDIYSTTERRIGTWIDGKPLYRKVFTYTAGSAINTNTIWYSNIRSALKINETIKIYGKIQSTTSTAETTIGMNSPSNFGQMGVWVNSNGDLTERHNDSWYNGTTVKIVLEYTKTTD